MIRALCLVLAVACAQQEEKPKKPKGKDGPGDPERRAKFLEGESAADAKALVDTNNPLHLDAVAKFFLDERKPYKERLAALQALRILKTEDEEEYKRVYPAVKTTLSLEASRGHGMGAIKEDEEEMMIEALSWHADMKYDHARYAMENYVDTDLHQVRAVKLPDRVRDTAARLLALYPPSDSVNEILWGTLTEKREREGLRQVCYETLAKTMKDAKARVLAHKPEAKDAWFVALQKKLLAEK